MTQIAEMRAVRLSAAPTLDTLGVSSVPVPSPGAGEVLLRVRATSLNFHDYLVVAGHIPQPEGRIPMSDGAGEIAALGTNVSGLAIGQKVMGAFFPHWVSGAPNFSNNAAISGETIDGFAADYVCVPAASLTQIPRGWSFEEAATLPCAGLTAWRSLVVEGKLSPGDTVLLPGSGGLSVYALQLATALGISTIVTSSSDAKLSRLSELGATHLVNYRTDPNWGTTVRGLTGDRGVDLVLEIGGDSSFAQSIDAVRMDGRIVVVGTTANGTPVLPLRQVVMHHIKVHGLAVGSVAHLAELVTFIETAGLHPVIDKAFPLEQLAEAFRYQLSRQHFGKIVVRLGDAG
jgi:NADPH:quinone reductase-like Zn-dependent oxidoreductase